MAIQVDNFLCEFIELFLTNFQKNFAISKKEMKCFMYQHLSMDTETGITLVQ